MACQYKQWLIVIIVGQGNINPDSNVYADGEIVREGPVSGHADEGPVVTGRGGAGNIGSPRQKPTERNDQEIIPETAIRDNGPGYENYHVGRGGEGNVHKDKTSHSEGHNGHHKGLGEKIKDAVTGHKD
ncbi:MAG: hypothetical protein M1812_003184 [Candelaria pacifica]|nr:MAG: hypothetical protein M1812_003184 [Candelaria pacifica]